MIKECKYLIAIGYDKKENFSEALKNFEEIQDYKDSAKKINQIHYKWGKKSFDAHFYEDAIKHLSSRSERRHVDDLMSTSRVHNYMPTYISIEAISICVHTLIADPSCKLFPLLF